MRITSISASAGRQMAHPANHRTQLKFSVGMTAELEDNDDPRLATLALQAHCELAVDQHQVRLLEKIAGEIIDSESDPAADAAARVAYELAMEGQAVS